MRYFNLMGLVHHGKDRLKEKLVNIESNGANMGKPRNREGVVEKSSYKCVVDEDDVTTCPESICFNGELAHALAWGSKSRGEAGADGSTLGGNANTESQAKRSQLE